MSFGQEGKSPGPIRKLQQSSCCPARTSSSSKGSPGPPGREMSLPQMLGSVSSQAGGHSNRHSTSPQPARQDLPPEEAPSFSPKRAAEVWDPSCTPRGCPFLSSSCRSPHRARGQESPEYEVEHSHQGWEQQGPSEQEHLGLSSRLGAGRESWEEPRMSGYTPGITCAQRSAGVGCCSCRRHLRGSSSIGRGQEAPSSPVPPARGSVGAFPHRRASWLLSWMTHSLLKCQYANTGSGINNDAAVRSRAPQLICPRRGSRRRCFGIAIHQAISRIQVTSSLHTHHGYEPTELLRRSPFQCKVCCNFSVQKT